MRALRIYEYGEPDVLRLEELPTPAPGPGLVLVRVAAAGVNFADVQRRKGLYLEPTALPYGVGIEVSGTVAAVGSGVAGLREGQRVTGFVRAGYAEYALGRPQMLFPIPDELDFERAAALPVQGLTAYHLLRTAARLQARETVLIHAAAGGVGLLLTQLAKLMEAGTVYGTASSTEKQSLAEANGADVTLNYAEHDFVGWIKENTQGRGVDVVLEAVGGEVTTRSLSCLKPFGRLVNYGRSSGHGEPLDVRALTAQNLTVTGFYLTGLLQRSDLVAEGMRALFDHVASGRLHIVVHPFPLAEAARAHAALEERATTGKLVLLPG
ncbi:MAG: quinone oxidoreductase [Chloroflexi bacterium]|nr:quinone oxidoreductase [Chloroflexota bacterium]